jgi:hypothetical protein
MGRGLRMGDRQRASVQLSLAEPSQTRVCAFPQVGAALTLGEAASQRSSAQGRWQGPGAKRGAPAQGSGFTFSTHLGAHSMSVVYTM